MNSYYSIDAILTDAHRVPCAFELAVPGLGYIDDNAGGDIAASTTIPLPLYLAELLALQRLGPSQSPLVSLDLPTCLSPNVLNALKADPKTVDLRQLVGGGGYWYALVARVLELFEEEEVGNVAGETFKKRAAEIADHASNPRGALGSGEGAEFLRGLDEVERQLFKATHESSKAMRIWMGEMKKKR